MTATQKVEHKEYVPENTPDEVPQRHGRTYQILAVAIAALIGFGIGWLVFRDTGSDTPVEANEPATPAEDIPTEAAPAAVGFPTGTFLNADPDDLDDLFLVLTFNEDGTYNYNVDGFAIQGEYTVDGDLFTDVVNNAQPSDEPATYIWTYDDGELTFELSGEDLNRARHFLYERPLGENRIFIPSE